MIDDRLDHKPEKTAVVNNSLTNNFLWLQSTAGQRCDFFEKQWLDCASRLGRDRGEIECAAQLRDLKQCSEMDLAYKRFHWFSSIFERKFKCLIKFERNRKSFLVDFKTRLKVFLNISDYKLMMIYISTIILMLF